ncbi:MAG: IreB family regulatory phosphoprotein [Bacillota bacterium]|nr:IreB family regulatory phosphoprotein [Bacillota bacterium]REJ36594.1 MAG: IreB family regulatory phosphoprotein [Bacillota bacterium]
MTGADRTMLFRFEPDRLPRAGRILREVYAALEEKGYDPVSQIVGYLLSGDPTYITSHRHARSLVRSVERSELLEELVKAYLSDRRMA